MDYNEGDILNLKLKKDQWIGMSFFLSGIILLLIISTIQPVMTLDPNDSGPKFFPRIATIGLMICGVGLIIKPGKNKEFMTLSQWLRAGRYFVVLIVYLFLMYFFGFIVSSILGLFVLIRMLAIEKKPNLIVAGIYSIIFTLVLYGVFVLLLKIVLPRGLIFG